MSTADAAVAARMMRGPLSRKDRLYKANSPEAAELRADLAASGYTLVELDEHGRDKYGISRGPVPLINAAQRGMSAAVRGMIDQGDDISLTNDADGFTALHAAAHHGHADVARMLAKAGSDLEAKTFEGDTPLHLATMEGETEVMEALIQEGASVDSRNPGGATPLYVAAMEGRLAAVKILLRAKANPLLTWSNSSGMAFVPLNVAAQTGRLAVVRELLREFGIRGCGGPSGGLDALRVAAAYGQVDMIPVLIDAGVVDAAGLALLLAIQKAQEASVACLLQQQKEGWQSFYVNTPRTDLGVTALLCSFHGADDGSKLCDPRITRRLIDAGADTSSVVQLLSLKVTPLEYLNDYVPREKHGDSPAADKHLHRLEAIRRLLLQAGAVRAVSWLWPDDATPLARRPAKGTRTAGHSPPTPLTTMLPALRRRARRRGLLSETLFRWVGGWVGGDTGSFFEMLLVLCPKPPRAHVYVGTAVVLHFCWGACIVALGEGLLYFLRSLRCTSWEKRRREIPGRPQ